MENYRKKYKQHYGIEFDGNYAVHHIDLDRTNNDISNLLLLPRGLHQKYHMLINSLGGIGGILNIDLRINEHSTTYNAVMLEHLGATLKEINKWAVYKNQLDMQKRIKNTRG